jgi:hypothetical protein
MNTHATNDWAELPTPADEAAADQSAEIEHSFRQNQHREAQVARIRELQRETDEIVTQMRAERIAPGINDGHVRQVEQMLADLHAARMSPVAPGTASPELNNDDEAPYDVRRAQLDQMKKDEAEWRARLSGSSKLPSFPKRT